MRLTMTSLAVALLVLPACKKTKSEPPPPVVADHGASDRGASMTAAGSGSGSSMAVETGSAAAGSDVTTVGSGQLTDMSGSNVDPTAMSHRAGNCPSTVPNSTTKVELRGKSVIVTVTSDDASAITAIKTRADELLRDKAVAKLAGDAPTPAHDQKGTHGGGIGICPVYVPEGATAKSSVIANGVAVAITPKSGADELEKDIEGRIVRATEWLKANGGGGGGTGGGGGKGTGGGKGGGGKNKGG